MRILTGIVFAANLGLWILGMVIGFAAGGAAGLILVLGFIAFLIAWHLSGGIVIAPADYFFQPEWSVFKTKLKWANGIGWGLVLLVFIFFASLG